jgi:starvation-inducible DNA-binding protein
MNTEISNIGLNAKETAVVAQKLNKLLCNYQMYYMNLRGFHWNIQGRKFFELHLKFEELYDDAIIKIDEIAERILTLSESPIHTFKKYIEESQIKAAENITDGELAIDNILSSLKTLLAAERDILQKATAANDEGTVSLMSDYIVQQEKLVWMLSAYKQ